MAEAKRKSHTFSNSTRLHRGWYDPKTRTVELEFRDLAHVVYREVSPAVWDGLRNARSAGRYVSEILERYPFRRR